MIIVFWFALAIAVGVFAEARRNRNGVGWFFLAVLLSPLLAFIFVAVMRPKRLGSLSSDRMIAGMSSGAAVAQDEKDFPLAPALIIGVPLALLIIAGLMH